VSRAGELGRSSAEAQMRRQLHIHSHLALITIACVALAGATAYFLLVIPRHLAPDDPDWLRAGAPWATAFAAQCGVFLAVACPVAAHALSGRWSWSVRVFAAVSAYWGVIMATLAVNAYEDAERLSGHVRSPAELLEGAMTLAAVFLLYLLLTCCTFVWIATRGRRFQLHSASTPNPHSSSEGEVADPGC
jgi:hypothetical protein